MNRLRLKEKHSISIDDYIVTNHEYVDQLHENGQKMLFKAFAARLDTGDLLLLLDDTTINRPGFIRAIRNVILVRTGE